MDMPVINTANTVYEGQYRQAGDEIPDDVRAEIIAYQNSTEQGRRIYAEITAHVFSLRYLWSDGGSYVDSDSEPGKWLPHRNMERDVWLDPKLKISELVHSAAHEHFHLRATVLGLSPDPQSTTREDYVASMLTEEVQAEAFAIVHCIENRQALGPGSAGEEPQRVGEFQRWRGAKRGDARQQTWDGLRAMTEDWLWDRYQKDGKGGDAEAATLVEYVKNGEVGVEPTGFGEFQTWRAIRSTDPRQGTWDGLHSMAKEWVAGRNQQRWVQSCSGRNYYEVYGDDYDRYWARQRSAYDAAQAQLGWQPVWMTRQSEVARQAALLLQQPRSQATQSWTAQYGTTRHGPPLGVSNFVERNGAFRHGTPVGRNQRR